jgi:hypothetical protein
MIEHTQFTQNHRLNRTASAYLAARIGLAIDPDPSGSAFLPKETALQWTRELARRGLCFARYADDFLSFVRSQKAADRALKSISRFIQGRLRLIINQVKSKAARLNACSFLD